MDALRWTQNTVHTNYLKVARKLGCKPQKHANKNALKRMLANFGLGIHPRMNVFSRKNKEPYEPQAEMYLDQKSAQVSVILYI